MNRLIKTVSLTVFLASAAIANAQAPSQNPNARPDHNVFGSGLGVQRPQSLGTSPTQSNAIGRPTSRFGPGVTPVPEPSEWAMLLAGLAAVGFIVRRNAKR